YKDYVTYTYTFSTWNDTLGYTIDYDGTYILSVATFTTTTSIDVAGIPFASVIFDCLPAILYAYGLDIPATDELTDEIFTEIKNKSRFSERLCRYGDYIIRYSSSEETPHLSVLRANKNYLKECEKTVGYTLTDISNSSSW
ncbi:MAG: hypothetical protein K2K42_00875, partial [Eubacterium sp.]|nr:hypothetical protein [Eubacterium sp.]